MVLVIRGTIAKNRWGISLDPVFCPRCGTPLPQIRKPRNARQALWGGATCGKCGGEVDKWGREITEETRLPSALGTEPEGQLGRLPRRNLAVSSAVIFFCLTFLSALLGIRPSAKQMAWKAWPVWMGVLCAATLETTILTTLFCVAFAYFLGKFVSKGHGRAGS